MDIEAQTEEKAGMSPNLKNFDKKPGDLFSVEKNVIGPLGGDFSRDDALQHFGQGASRRHAHRFSRFGWTGQYQGAGEIRPVRTRPPVPRLPALAARLPFGGHEKPTG